jgi:hypothetical protein
MAYNTHKRSGDQSNTSYIIERKYTEYTNITAIYGYKTIPGGHNHSELLHRF